MRSVSRSADCRGPTYRYLLIWHHLSTLLSLSLRLSSLRLSLRCDLSDQPCSTYHVEVTHVPHDLLLNSSNSLWRRLLSVRLQLRHNLLHHRLTRSPSSSLPRLSLLRWRDRSTHLRTAPAGHAQMSRRHRSAHVQLRRSIQRRRMRSDTHMRHRR